MQNRVMSAVTVCSQAALVIVLILSAAGHLGRFHKNFELASHFRAQYLIASLACLVVAAAFRARPWALAALLCALLNAGEVARWYMPAGRETHAASAAGRRLKIVLANVNYANTQYAALIDFVRREEPDILVAQEVSDAWGRQLKALGDEFPFSQTAIKEGGSGIAVYSRMPLEEAKVIFLGGLKRPSIEARIRVDDSAAVSLLTIHPYTPLTWEQFERRNRELAAASAHVKEMPAPKIFVGDLNTTLWSPFYTDFVKESDLVDSRRGFGVLPSWPTFLPFALLRIPIDHCLVSPDVAVVSVRTGENVGSDHLPLVVELELPRAGRDGAVVARSVAGVR